MVCQLSLFSVSIVIILWSPALRQRCDEFFAQAAILINHRSNRSEDENTFIDEYTVHSTFQCYRVIIVQYVSL